MLGKPRYKWKSGKMELQFSFYYEGIIKMGAIPLQSPDYTKSHRIIIMIYSCKIS